MIHVENKAVINRTVGTVYSFLLDGTNTPKWRSDVLEASLKTGRPGLINTEYQQVLRGPMGREIRADYKLVVLEPDRQIAFNVTAGPVRPYGNFYFMEIGAGTELTFTLDYNPKGLSRLISWPVAKVLRNEVDSLSDLKHYLEKQTRP